MSNVGRKMRVLLLHGYAMNQVSFRRRIAALQKSCQDVAEFVFANGPHHIQALPSATNPDPPPPNPNDPLDKQARAWFMSRDNVYIGWDATAKYLTQVCREEGPFDGVIGFSQGACLAGVLAAATEHPDRTPETNEPIQSQPFRFVIAVSGFRPTDSKFDPLFTDKIQTPMLVVLGENDAIVSAERTRKFVERCANVRVVSHPGEHYIPTKYVFISTYDPFSASWRHFLHDVLASFARNDTHAWLTIPAQIEQAPQKDSVISTSSNKL